MYLAIKIFPIELTMDRNFKKYFHKFGAYLFTMDQMKCKILHCIFKEEFKEGLEKYTDEENKLYHALMINDKVYP